MLAPIERWTLAPLARSGHLQTCGSVTGLMNYNVFTSERSDDHKVFTTGGSVRSQMNHKVITSGGSVRCLMNHKVFTTGGSVKGLMNDKVRGPHCLRGQHSQHINTAGCGRARLWLAL